MRAPINLVIVVVTLQAIAPLPVRAEQMMFGHQPFFSNVYRIDDYAVTPSVTFLNSTGVGLLDIAIHPLTGQMYGAGSQVGSGTLGVFEINPFSGADPVLVVETPGVLVNALEFATDGTLWGWGGTTLYRIDEVEMTIDAIGDVGFTSDGDLASDADVTLYGTADDPTDSFNTNLITINTNTGAGTLVGPLGEGDAFGLEIDVDGLMYMASNGGNMFTVDKLTAETTLVDFFGVQHGGMTFVLAPLPEPATVLFMGAGLFTALGRRRTQQRR